MVLPTAIEEAVLDYRKRLERRFPGRVSSLRVFGSYARGTAHEDSDVDVLVLVRDLSRPEKHDAVGLGVDVSMERDFSVDVSPLVMTPEDFQLRVDRERRLALEILSEGVAL